MSAGLPERKNKLIPEDTHTGKFVELPESCGYKDHEDTSPALEIMAGVGLGGAPLGQVHRI